MELDSFDLESIIEEFSREVRRGGLGLRDGDVQYLISLIERVSDQLEIEIPPIDVWEDKVKELFRQASNRGLSDAGLEKLAQAYLVPFETGLNIDLSDPQVSTDVLEDAWVNSNLVRQGEISLTRLIDGEMLEVVRRLTENLPSRDTVDGIPGLTSDQRNDLNAAREILVSLSKDRFSAVPGLQPRGGTFFELVYGLVLLDRVIIDETDALARAIQSTQFPDRLQDRVRELEKMTGQNISGPIRGFERAGEILRIHETAANLILDIIQDQQFLEGFSQGDMEVFGEAAALLNDSLASDDGGLKPFLEALWILENQTPRSQRDTGLDVIMDRLSNEVAVIELRRLMDSSLFEEISDRLSEERVSVIEERQTGRIGGSASGQGTGGIQSGPIGQ